MKISAKHNIDKIVKGLSDKAKNQIPFAASKAINHVITTDLKPALEGEMRAKLDRPTPFTQRAFRYTRATKRNLVGVVYAQSIQEKYLTWQTEGGTRRPEGKAIPIPAGARRNSYGNMPKGALSRFKGTKFFSGVPKGRPGAPAGIYQRMGKGGRANLKLLVKWQSSASYKKRLDFDSVAQRIVGQKFEAAFKREMAAALLTAR